MAPHIEQAQLRQQWTAQERPFYAFAGGPECLADFAQRATFRTLPNGCIEAIMHAPGSRTDIRGRLRQLLGQA